MFLNIPGSLRLDFMSNSNYVQGKSLKLMKKKHRKTHFFTTSQHIFSKPYVSLLSGIHSQQASMQASKQAHGQTIQPAFRQTGRQRGRQAVREAGRLASGQASSQATSSQRTLFYGSNTHGY